MTAPPLETVAFSELLREPTTVADRLSKGVRAVLLRRRGADDLVLMTADRAEREREVFELTAKLLGELARRDSTVAVDVVTSVLPWVRFLPPDAVPDMIAELVDTAIAAGSIGNVAPVSVVLSAWKATAEAYADPELLAILKAPITEDHGLVPMPEVE